jgi:exonuclease III
MSIPAAEDRSDSMKIATYNVNGVNGRLPVLLRWLADTEPDVVCLQELKAPQDKFPAAAIQQVGYGSIWHGQKSWNGVASSRAARSRSNGAAACLAMRRISIAATSRPR